MNQQPGEVVLVIGTRPEAIKQLPIYFALKRVGVPVKICATAQHSELAQQIFSLFEVAPDFILQPMQAGYDLAQLTSALLNQLTSFFVAQKPRLVVVQGDTTSAYSAALAAFYLQIPVAHIEAGLRTNNLAAPFPEEFNRQAISLIAKYHFTPTEVATANLLKFGINPRTIFQVGNTGMDAQRLILGKIGTADCMIPASFTDLVKKFKAKKRKLVLFTVHRRESLADVIKNLLGVVKNYAELHPEVAFVYPVHPNPQIQTAVQRSQLACVSNIYLCPPLLYHELTYLLSQADCVVTDSGGLQEEAVGLGCPVIVLRQELDRPESVTAGLAWSAGYDPDLICSILDIVLQLNKFQPSDLYGDGRAAERVAQTLKQELI